MTMLGRFMDSVDEIQYKIKEIEFYIADSTTRKSEIEGLLNDFRHIREGLKNTDAGKIKSLLLQLDEREKELLSERRIIKQELVWYDGVKTDLSKVGYSFQKFKRTFDYVTRTPLYNVRTTEGNVWFEKFLEEGANFKCELGVTGDRTTKSVKPVTPIQQQPVEIPTDNIADRKHLLKLQRNKKRKEWELVDIRTNKSVGSSKKLRSLLDRVSALGNLIEYPNELSTEIKKVI